ncbi:hypothetical protein D3C74_394940 [compost metagenome]
MLPGTKVKPAGSVSDRTTLAALAEPPFVMVAVYVTVSPATAPVAVNDFATVIRGALIST